MHTSSMRVRMRLKNERMPRGSSSRVKRRGLTQKRATVFVNIRGKGLSTSCEGHGTGCRGVECSPAAASGLWTGSGAPEVTQRKKGGSTDNGPRENVSGAFATGALREPLYRADLRPGFNRSWAEWSAHSTANRSKVALLTF